MSSSATLLHKTPSLTSIQFIFGLGQLAVAIALYACASVQWRFSTGPQGYLVSLIPLAMATILISGIGICYCKNRQNIHWKIMSVLDWLAVFATVASVAVSSPYDLRKMAADVDLSARRRGN